MKKTNIFLSILALTALTGTASSQIIRAGGEAPVPKSQRSAARDGDPEWAQLSSPSLGYYVRGKQVRLILGVPGAAHLSDPVASPEGLARAYAAPGHEWVLAISKQTARSWRPETGQTWALEGVEGLPTLFAISPTGREAAFYFEATGRLVVYGGLPDQPEVLQSRDGLLWPQGMTELALAPGGNSLAGIAEGGLYLLSPDPETAPVALHSSSTLRGLSFGATEEQIAFLDTAADSLMLAQRQEGTYFVQPIAGSGQGLSALESAAFDPFGQIWVASRENSSHWRVDPASGGVTLLETSSPGRIERLRLRGALMISSLDVAATRIALIHDGAAELSWVPAPIAPAELTGAADTAAEVRQ